MEVPVKILFIGGDEDYIITLSQLPGYSVDIAANMLEAVNYFMAGNNVSAILCGLKVAGGGGFRMYEWIRERPKFDIVPFILISGEFSAETYREAFIKKVDDYYVAPLPAPQSLSMRLKFLIGFRGKNATSITDIPADIPYRMPLTKRLFDILVASGVLVVLSPFLLFIILAIRLESRGKVYYISKRIGRKPFDFYKLRSMKVGADAELNKLAKEKNQYLTEKKPAEIDFTSPCPRCSELPEGETCSPVLHIAEHAICDYWYNFQKKEVAKSKSAFIKIADDPRITKVGKFIRNTSIDELPQLINVLKGDMSIVGNRPLPVYEAEMLTKDDMSKRFLAPAGITGLWQVELRGRGGNMSEEERKSLDNEYADHFAGNNYSFWYDMKLILKTIPALLQKDTV
jgi:lipopolysaccharide/colanic/teichoic acid biosynthesis glycosyltransferase